jgi:hypothetical protein
MKYHAVVKIKKLNRIVVEAETNRESFTRIYMIVYFPGVVQAPQQQKKNRVKLVLFNQTFPLSEMMLPFSTRLFVDVNC